MITWLDTFDGLNLETARSIKKLHRTTDLFGDIGYGTTSEFENSSRSENLETIINIDSDGGETLITRLGIAIRGTTNSTITAVNRTSITVKDLFSTTTTEKTRPYTFEKTGQTSTETTVYTTSQFENNPTTATTTTQATTIFTTATNSLQSVYVDTTTFDGTFFTTPAIATILQAEEGQVIWVANTSAALNRLDIVAATQFATSTTRTTITPWTETVVAELANIRSSSTWENPLFFRNIEFQDLEGLLGATSTQIIAFNSLPNQTEVIFFDELITALRNTNVLDQIAQQENFNIAGGIDIFTRFSSAETTVTGFYGASSFRQRISTSTSFTRYRSTDIGSIFSSTQSGTALFTDSTTSFERYETTALTAIRQRPQDVTMYYGPDFFNRSEDTNIDAFNGVATPNNQIAAGYSCSVDFGYLPEITALQSRGVVTILPTEVTADDEKHELTISGLSVTYRATSATQTQFLILEPFGAPQRTGSRKIDFTLLSNAIINPIFIPNKLGISETAYRTTARGAYWNGSFTESFNHIASTYTEGQSFAWNIPISYISANTDYSEVFLNAPRLANQIWWTTSRNSHVDFSLLTREEAYERP
jgi:hypothetical protein